MTLQTLLIKVIFMQNYCLLEREKNITYISYILTIKASKKHLWWRRKKECPVIYLWIVELQHSLKKSNVCSLSLLNKYVKIVCGWKFVFKPASPEYVVSRRPNKATNYLVLLIFCKQQEGQQIKHPHWKVFTWSNIAFEQRVTLLILSLSWKLLLSELTEKNGQLFRPKRWFGHLI